MAWIGKTPDASDGESRRLASEWRGQAVETEVDAIGKSKREQDDAAARAESQRKVADQIDPDKK